MKHTIYPERTNDDGETEPAVVVDVPDVLYLQVVDTDDCEDFPAPLEPSERTFTIERLNASDVAYVPLSRAERAEAAIATERDAAAEAELASVLVLLGGGDPAESESEDMATAVVDAIFALRAERDALRAQLDAARAGQVQARCCYCNKPATMARTYYDRGFPSAREHLCAEHFEHHPWHGDEEARP